MTIAMRNEIPAFDSHRGGCDCELLAHAMGLRGDAVSFDFCIRVLQKHWRLRCNHGGVPGGGVPAVARWTDLGSIDAVKAVLISNSTEPGPLETPGRQRPGPDNHQE